MSKKYLMPIGGNEVKSVDSEIFKEMVLLAGGTDARIVVVPTASDTPRDRAQDYLDLFTTFQPASVEMIHIGERMDAGLPRVLEVVNKATLLLFAGGDQLRLSSLIGGTPLIEALEARYMAGACVIAGTSAGAAFLSETMIFQNNRFQSYRKGGLEMTKGSGLIRDTVFDTHFVQRSRISRLVHAVASNPALLGFGIEEDTALLIEDGRVARVMGSGTVIVVDGRQSEFNHIGYVENDSPFAITSLLYSVLTSGMKFDLHERRVVDPGPGAPPKSVLPGD